MLKDSLRTRGIIVEAGFIPQPIKIERKSLIDFQAGVESYLTLTEIQKGDNFIQMTNKSDSSDSETRISLTKEKVSIHILFPDQSIESLIDIFDEIVKLAGNLINAQILVPIVVNIRKQLSTQGKDSRQFFSQNILNLSQEKQKFLERPIQTMGIKLMLPPFISGENGGSTDGVELKIETLNEDPRDLYIEIHRIFSNPIPCLSFKTMRDFISQTEHYINNNVLNFLT